MLKGQLDSLTSSGYAEGWAYDTVARYRPVTVSIQVEGETELGWGSAHRYREDLTDAGRAAGWCAFRIKLNQPATALCWRAVSMMDRESHLRIAHQESVPYVVADEVTIASLPALIADDPTVIQSLHHLRGCNELFADFIKARGVDGFVRTAYVYLLSRAADAKGLKAYRSHFLATKPTPFELLLIMSDSDEYRSRSRQHCAPTMAAFPFHADRM